MTVLYTAPTAIRMFMKAGRAVAAKYNMTSLRLLGSVGEPINPEAWIWYRKNFGRDQLPDHGHLVADRDGHLRGISSAHHAAEARLCDLPAARIRRGCPG